MSNNDSELSLIFAFDEKISLALPPNPRSEVVSSNNAPATSNSKANTATTILATPEWSHTDKNSLSSLFFFDM